MTLEELTRRVPNFGALPHADKIKLFVWWLHAHGNKPHAQPRDVAQCYQTLSIAAPADLSSSFRSLVDQRQLLRSSAGYRLERRIADDFSGQWGHREGTVHVENLLLQLPSRVPQLNEREYLAESLICLRNGAFRATVVMAWNLAYDHVCEWILADDERLANFNAQSPKSYPRMSYPRISRRDDFTEFSESHVLQIAKSGRLITDSVHKVLKEKLDRRNVSAHPSGVRILQATAEEVIRDLVENVVLKLQ